MRLLPPTRREFLALSVAGIGAAAAQEDPGPEVMTVTGRRPARDLGVTLPHEHVLVDFVGAAGIRPGRYDPDEAFRAALPHLRRVRELGAASLVECTPAYLGRDPSLLKRLSEASGLRILTNTGYYGGAAEKYLPADVHEEDADGLADRWLIEWAEGIDGTGVRPGFIKTRLDGHPLTATEQKLLRAAARVHLDTGLAIAAHTERGAVALAELDILAQEGVSGSAFIWVHAQNEGDETLHARAAERGAWVEFDGLASDTVEQHVAFARGMTDRGYLGQVLVSHDAGWYHVGEPGGGTFRSFDTLFTGFLPALRRGGFTDEQIRTLTASNPQAAFALRVRRP
jgi:phosphotriesterase-related protein